MIPVKLKPEPESFDQNVRQKGNEWLKHHPDPSPTQLPPYWQAVSRDLWESYSGICAYLAIYFDFATGASTTDHFLPKSQSPTEAYEWRNYRLACLAANRKKAAQEVLDPFEIEEDSFRIDFLDGSIYPNREKKKDYQKLCEDTINKLDLNSHLNREKRQNDFTEYCKGHVSKDYLRRHSPFVYSEIVRQKIQPVNSLETIDFLL